MELKSKLKHISSLFSSPGEVLGNLWRFLTTKSADDLVTPRKSLCVSIEPKGVSVAFVSYVLSKTTIKGFRKYTFDRKGFPEPDEVATSAFMATKELEAEDAEITLSIPKAWTIMRSATFPAAVKENIEMAIRYELDRLTPYAHDEAYYGFKILSEDEEKLTLALYVANEGIVHRYLDALTEKGITISKVTVNLAGIGALLRYMNKNKDSLFVNVYEDGYEGALFSDGYAVEAFSGTLTKDFKTNTFVGLIKPKSKNAKRESILDNLLPLKDMFRDKKTLPPILLLGEQRNPILSRLTDEKQDLPVTTLDDEFVKPSLPAIQHGIPYVAVGGALESCSQDGIDLLTKGRQLKLKTPIAISAIILIGIAGLLLYRMIMPLQFEKKELLEIDRQIRMQRNDLTRALKIKEEVEALEKEIDGISKFKSSAPFALQIIKEVTANLPESAWATAFKFKGNSVIVSGYADSSAGLLSKLEASSSLKNVAFTSPTLRDRRTNKERFSIKMEVEGAGDSGKEAGK